MGLEMKEASLESHQERLSEMPLAAAKWVKGC